MRKLKFFFSLILSLAIFSSCNKDDDDNQTHEVTPQNCLLSKVLDQNNNPLIEIIYNSHKEAIAHLNHPLGDSYSYTYTNGKLATVSHARIHPSPSYYLRTYSVNSDGLVIKETHTSQTNPNKQLFGIFDYDSEKRKSRFQFFEKGVNGQPDKFRSQEWHYYDSDGNNVKSLFATGQDTVSEGSIYEYDNKPNPFYHLKILPSVWTGSKNNPIRVYSTNYDSVGTLISQNLRGNYQNEYNKDGLLIKSIYIPADGSGNEIRKYEYICN